MESLLELIIVIALVGLFVWAITSLVPMPEQFKKAIFVLSVVFVVLYFLQALGLLHSFHVPRLR